MELYSAPYEPFNLMEPYEPQVPVLTERMLRSSTAEFYCERFEEPEALDTPSEPDNSLNLMQQVPGMPLPVMLPPNPAENQAKQLAEIEEPILAEDDITCGPLDMPSMHFTNHRKLRSVERPKTAKRTQANAETQSEA